MAGILAQATPVAIIGTPDHKRAAGFYRDTLELERMGEDAYATEFRCGGMAIRLSTIPDFVPTAHTVLGFSVPDVVAAVAALSAKGVRFNRYAHFTQDTDGVWTAPDGKVKVAWFNDPDGNVLSVAQF